MKNVIFKLLLFCCIGLLSSCSKDDNNISTDIDASQIHLSVLFPEELSATRSVIENHKLRCILEVYTKEANRLVYREETVVDPG